LIFVPGWRTEGVWRSVRREGVFVREEAICRAGVSRYAPPTCISTSVGAARPPPIAVDWTNDRAMAHPMAVRAGRGEKIKRVDGGRACAKCQRAALFFYGPRFFRRAAFLIVLLASCA